MTYMNEGLVSNKANGYRDLLAYIDLSTYRRIPWEDNVPFFLLRFADQDTHDYIPVDPRSLLEKIAEDAKAQGWDCMGGAEFEVGFTVPHPDPTLTCSTFNTRKLPSPCRTRASSTLLL